MKTAEKTVGKGEIARYEQFLLFPVFTKDLYHRHVNNRACLGEGKGRYKWKKQLKPISFPPPPLKKKEDPNRKP